MVFPKYEFGAESSVTALTFNCACVPAIATYPTLTVKLKTFLYFHHGSKIVGHNADIPSPTTLFALTRAGG
jgi:hypothetical protein